MPLELLLVPMRESCTLTSSLLAPPATVILETLSSLETSKGSAEKHIKKSASNATQETPPDCALARRHRTFASAQDHRSPSGDIASRAAYFARSSGDSDSRNAASNAFLSGDEQKEIRKKVSRNLLRMQRKRHRPTARARTTSPHICSCASSQITFGRHSVKRHRTFRPDAQRMTIFVHLYLHAAVV